MNASICAINEQIKQNAQKTKTATELSENSIISAQDGNVDMEHMLTAMEEIKTVSSDVAKIIKVIDDIAFQTNILALNAAVEAARAGLHGKGFAVVAEEVRSLAGRSQKAAQDTSLLIEDVLLKVKDGAEIAVKTADSLKAMVEDINSISVIVDEIDKSTIEQMVSINQINIGINQISAVVQVNSSTSEEFAASAEELSSQSEMLANMISGFKY